jgi:hypothetical protein
MLPDSPHPFLSFSAWFCFFSGFVDRCETKEGKDLHKKKGKGTASRPGAFIPHLLYFVIYLFIFV